MSIISRNTLVASFLALASAVIGVRLGQKPMPLGRLKRYPLKKCSWSNPHQGEKECARRRQQIERGMLKSSNGLA